MTQILGVGNALIDALVRIEDTQMIHNLKLALGGMTLIDHDTFLCLQSHLYGQAVERSTGGSAGNALLAAAALGVSAAFVGKTGHDDNGNFFTATREAQGVRPISLHHPQLPTGTCTSFVLPDGQRTMATYLGASATLRADDLKAEWFEEVSHVFVEGYLVQDHTLIERVFSLGRSAGAKMCLDLAAWNIVEKEHSLLGSLLRDTDIVFANEEEACAMLRLPQTQFDGEQAARQLSALCRGTAVVKGGEAGAWAVRGDNAVRVDAVAVPAVIDTTAAGDFFAGAFLTAAVKGASLEQCLQAGALSAAEVIQVMGTSMTEAAWKRLNSWI